MALGVPVIGGLLDIGGKLIDHFFPDPEEKAKAQAQLLQMHQAGELKELEVRMSAILAEAQSSDPWTSRARPMFLYVMYGVIGLCFIGGILGIWWPGQVEQAAANIKGLLGAIPEALWALFGAGYLGYTTARSYDKKTKTAR